MYQALHTQLESTLYILRAVSNRDPYGRLFRWFVAYIYYKTIFYYICFVFLKAGKALKLPVRQRFIYAFLYVNKHAEFDSAV